jgi:hypothetical protein
LIDYFKSHARRVFESASIQKDDKRIGIRIGNALKWVKKRGGTVTAREAQMHGVCKDADAAKQLLEDLQEAGYGVVTEYPSKKVEFRLHDATAAQQHPTSNT